MSGEINNVQFGTITMNSNKPVTDFEKSTDVIQDEILSFASNNYGDLITSLGLDAANMSAMDLADALNNNENSAIASEVSELQNTLAQATFDLAKTFYTDENITQTDFEDDRESSINLFSAFNKDGDKAVELQSFVLEAISEYGLNEEEAQEVYKEITESANNEKASSTKTDDTGKAEKQQNDDFNKKISQAGEYGISKADVEKLEEKYSGSTGALIAALLNKGVSADVIAQKFGFSAEEIETAQNTQNSALS